MALMIPAELVPPLRDGLHFDLAMQVDAIDALIEPRHREDVSAEVGQCFDRANGTRALLDIAGWVESEGGSSAIDLDAYEHGEALLRSLCVRIGSDRGTGEDTLASAEQRSEAKVLAEQLADLARQVEKVIAEGIVTVPAKLVNMLREVLAIKLADAAEGIKESGHSHPDYGIPEDELKAFDIYRELLEQVGPVLTRPATQLDLNLRREGYRSALASALRDRLDFERYMKDVEYSAEGSASQRRSAQRKARQIEDLMACVGLEVE